MDIQIAKFCHLYSKRDVYSNNIFYREKFSWGACGVECTRKDETSNGCFQGQIFLRKLLIGANPTETFFNVCLFLFTFMACYCWSSSLFISSTLFLLMVRRIVITRLFSYRFAGALPILLALKSQSEVWSSVYFNIELVYRHATVAIEILSRYEICHYQEKQFVYVIYE